MRHITYYGIDDSHVDSNGKTHTKGNGMPDFHGPCAVTVWMPRVVGSYTSIIK